jgi:glucokinase
MGDPGRFAVCLDIGGTSVKSAVVREDGAIATPSLSLKAVRSNGSAECILRTFVESAASAFDFARSYGMPIAGIGVSTCGPFDYENGVSLITGLDKYESIYGMNVKKHMQKALGVPGTIPFLFDIDSWSFARGEVWSGAGQHYNRSIVFTLGTGVGSAFAVGKEIVSEGAGVPWLGWISGQKHRDGILNDYISRTFMVRKYRELSGTELDVKEMGERASCGDAAARDVFRMIGEELGEFLKEHHVRDFQAECIVFGGQIAKSFDLFVGPIRSALGGIECLKAIVRAADIECSALKGAARYVFGRLLTC